MAGTSSYRYLINIIISENKSFNIGHLILIFIDRVLNFFDNHIFVRNRFFFFEDRRFDGKLPFLSSS